MSKELKNKIDSIRRTLKSKGLEITATVIELKILELFPNYPDDWCADSRTEVIKSIIKDTQSSCITPVLDDCITPVEHVQQEPETQKQQGEEDNTVSAIAPAEDNQLVVSDSDKQALVSTQSCVLGLQLSEEETAGIADSIDDVFSDYSSFVGSVTTAIKRYIAHKFDAIEDELDNSSNDVRGYLADRNLRVKEKLKNYATNVRSIQEDTQLIRQDLNTSKELILSRFRT
jgi:hypothetical protein